MISNLTIKGFRALRELRVDPLTRVNLFVGSNNAGKTSILEAAELVALGSTRGLNRSLRRRGEEILVDREDRVPASEWDPSHLFYGHSLALGNSFEISDDDRQRWFTCEVAEVQLHSQEGELQEESDPEGDFDFTVPALKISSQSTPGPSYIRLSPLGGLGRLVPYAAMKEPGPAVNFLGTEAVLGLEVGRLWDSLVLTPEEEGVARALRIIEPQIERIAFLGDNRRSSRGIFVKLAGSDKRIPLGSIGDGLKRLLNLTIHMVSAKGGYLLVDEIDTGLHHSVMVDMWKLVIETAKRLEVQVFATTHSLDCLEALAWVQERSAALAAEVTLHRIDRETSATVVYTMAEIAIASRGQIEVR